MSEDKETVWPACSFFYVFILEVYTSDHRRYGVMLLLRGRDIGSTFPGKFQNHATDEVQPYKIDLH